MTIFALDMGGTNWKVALMRNGNALTFRAVPNNSTESDLERLPGLFDALLEEAGLPPADVAGIGLSIAEIVDTTKKTCPSPCDKHPYLQGRDLASLITVGSGLPVQVENDARAALLGELRFGVLRDRKPCKNVLMLTFGTGIGVGALVDGRLLRGAHHTGSILGGHITVDRNGPPCHCGNIGCAEAIASGWALADQLPARAGFGDSVLASAGRPDFEALCTAVRSGDVFARTALDECRSVWESLIVSLVHLTDPSVVVLSGGFMKSADLFLDPLQDGVRDRMWDPSNCPEFLVTDQPDLSALRGAEALVREATDGPIS